MARDGSCNVGSGYTRKSCRLESDALCMHRGVDINRHVYNLSLPSRRRHLVCVPASCRTPDDECCLTCCVVGSSAGMTEYRSPLKQASHGALKRAVSSYRCSSRDHYEKCKRRAKQCIDFAIQDTDRREGWASPHLQKNARRPVPTADELTRSAAP